MFRFEKLEIWHQSIRYSKNIYLIADTLPKAEGSGSSTNKDFSHFLDIAIKSTIETVSQLKFGQEMNYFRNTDVEKLYDQAEVLIKRIQAFKKSLK